jgi:hypothetical protein
MAEAFILKIKNNLNPIQDSEKISQSSFFIQKIKITGNLIETHFK